MYKYKKCPHCGTHNLPKMLECVECEESLISVPIMDEVSEKAAEEKAEKEGQKAKDTESSNMVRICEECGAHNPVNARKCGSCGEDISDIIPMPETSALIQPVASSYVFASLDGEYVYQFTDDSAMIGRTENMQDYLGKKTYVSRQHALISLCNGKLYVQNLSKTNYTFVNNVQIPDGTEFELHDGDELALGGNEQNGNRQEQAAYFQIRIESCS